MSEKMELMTTVASKSLGRGGLLIRKHSPEILLSVGIAGVIVSTVMACRATTKAEMVLDEAQEKLAKIKHVKETAFEEDYSDQDHKKDLFITYVQSGVGFVKVYGPAVTLGLASIGCILGAHGIMRSRNVALMVAYKGLEQSFSDYRRRVIEEFGEEKNRQFRNGLYSEKITVEEVDEKGKKTKVKKEVERVDPNHYSQYAKFFDESSTQWSKTPEYNFTFLKCQQNHANDLLHSRGHIFLNEVYDMLGLPRSQAGALVGWVDGVGDDFVDFSIFDGDDLKRRDFVNGYERSILLDFNVSGVIYDMI